MNHFLRIADRLGFVSLFSSIWTWMTQQFMNVDWNDTFMLISSFLGVVWLVMRIYDQSIITSQRKKEDNTKR
jgi:hypothetical protein